MSKRQEEIRDSARKVFSMNHLSTFINRQRHPDWASTEEVVRKVAALALDFIDGHLLDNDAIREVAQPLADERNELRNMLAKVREGIHEDSIESVYIFSLRDKIDSLLTKYPKNP
jgi:hypothetical protein